MVNPFEKSNKYHVDYHQIKPINKYKFPWNGKRFYGVFPESFQQLTVEIEAPSSAILNTDYDLVVLAYQIWYLTPSIPTCIVS